MELRRTVLTVSPDGARARLTARVAYDGGPAEETYRFDVPAERADDLSRTGSPWLAALLPLAVTLGEPLRIKLPVDPRLLYGARELMDVWAAWYPPLRPVEIEAPVSDAPAGTPRRDATFLSGGVDSLFTVLRGRNGTPSATPQAPDDLITVVGFDIPVDARGAGARLVARNRGLAESLGSPLIDVWTNLRETSWRQADWGRMAHGPALAAVALLLEPRYRSARIAATGGFRDLHPWGSHPLTDPLLSTRSLRIAHDGAAFTKVEKTRHISEFPAALDALHVCWRLGADHNCGACAKCYRTMLMLELVGALEQCPTFVLDRVPPAAAARVLCSESWDWRELRDIASLAARVDRPDLAAAVETAMRGSRRLRRRLHRLDRLRAHRYVPDRPLLALRSRLLRDWIT